MAKPNAKDTGITVKKNEDMSEWYEQVCLKAELAEFAEIKGFFVVRPNGWSIWESIQEFFNKELKKINVQNCAFPMLVPEHYFEIEAEHAEGFAPEVAWVDRAGKSKLEEPLAIRPTSETIISESFKRWLRSHRDLPIKTNQWCSVVRWETKQTKLFLRSREFWWQEGHCIYETQEDCHKETLHYVDLYRRVSEEVLAVPVLVGKKTDGEKFAGADATYTIEGFMPDGKALQMGTSHDLGQGFMKAFGVSFVGKDEKKHVPFYNSWGISTRMIGALVMVHGDDKGVVMPPNAALHKTVVVPIVTKTEKESVLKEAHAIAKTLGCHCDDRDGYSPGWKFNEWELKGVPVRVELGPRDLAEKQAVLVRRDTGDKITVKIDDIKKEVSTLLQTIQKEMFTKAKKFLEESIVEAKSFDDVQKIIKDKKIAKGTFCGSEECEEEIKDKTGGATSRCIDMKEKGSGTCIQCGTKTDQVVYYSKTY